MVTKSGEKLLYEDLTYQIRGACFEVWKEFGGAFKEKVIDRALTEELKRKGVKVENQKKINIYYKGEKIASYVPDKIINDLVLLEIKCKPFLTKEDEKQFWYYLKGSNYKVGLLVNFGSKNLEIRRRIFDKAREKLFRVNPRSNPRLSASTKKGFTLIEIMTVTAIILILSGIFYANYRAGGKEYTLLRTANKLAQDVRRVQEMGISAKECQNPVACPSGGVPRGGYGFYIDKFSDDRYMIYADSNSDKRYTNGEEIETIYLEQRVYIKNLVPSSANFSINFKPPDPEIKIKDNAGQDKDNVTITIALRTDPTKTKTITVNKAGLIDID